MKGQKQGRSMYRWLLILSSLIVLVIGCAGREKREVISLPTTAAVQNTIKKITVEETKDGKKVSIEGKAPLAYTFSKLQSQPLELLIDIPHATLVQEATVPLIVNDGIVQDITAIQYDKDVQIVIHLNKLIKYQVVKEDNALSLFIGKEGQIFLKREKKDEMPFDKRILPPIIAESIKKEIPPAKNLIDVAIDTSQKDITIVRLKADGALGDYNSFNLSKPTRLVIDLWKIKRKFSKKMLSVKSPYLKQVRLGDYPQKVRLVFDFASATPPSYRADRIGSELIISMGAKDAVVKTLPQETTRDVVVSEVEKSATVSLKPGEITGIDFKQLDNASRIIISTSTKALYQITKKPDNTVVIVLRRMTIPRRLKRSLDTHEFMSPVLSVTPADVGTGNKKSGRVVVKLRKMVAFEAKQDDDKIYLDFDRTEEFKGEKTKPIEIATTQQTPSTKKIETPATVNQEVTPKQETIPAATKSVAAPASSISGEGAAEQKIYTGKKITLDFKDADIDNILRLFAEVSDLNIIASGDVKGTVTIRLVDVPWDQAFDLILQANNLGAEKIGNVVRIVPLERLTAERRMRADATKATEESEPIVTEVIPINYGIVKEIGEKGIKPILSSRGKVVVDERTNTIIITDIRSNVEKAKLLARTLDAQTPQVLIQAQIIEANLDFSRDLGITWGGSLLSTNLKGGGTLTATGASSGDLAVDLPAAVGSGAGGALQFVLANLKNTPSLRVKLSALESTGEGKIISSPRLTTLDNKEASIEQGLRIPYLKINTDGTVATDFIEANLKLTVTPHVTSDGYIRMEIDVKKDTPDDSIKVLEVPAIDKKEVKTEVLVKDGEVVVIGGIYTYTKTNSVAAVPLFYKIPLLGWLFQKKSKDDNKKELLIFIAPNIVQPRRIITS
jgi:type IV pilus assembly protein PilQ